MRRAPSLTHTHTLTTMTLLSSRRPAALCTSWGQRGSGTQPLSARADHALSTSLLQGERERERVRVDWWEEGGLCTRGGAITP